MLKATIENFPMRGSRKMLRRMDTRALVSTGWSAADRAFWGAKFTSTFTLSGGSLVARWTGGSSLNCSPSARWMAVGAIARDMGRSLAATRGFGIPIGRADALGPVPHQPIDVILAFADIEGALQIGVALGVFFNGRHADMLREVNRLVGMVLGRDAKQDVEQIFRADQLFQRDGDLVSGVKSQIEPKRRLGGSDGAGQVLARFAGFEHRHIGIEDVDVAVEARPEHQNLGARQRSAYQ